MAILAAPDLGCPRQPRRHGVAAEHTINPIGELLSSECGRADFPRSALLPDPMTETLAETFAPIRSIRPTRFN